MSDFYDEDGDMDADEWREGQCDNCYGSEQPIDGPLGQMHCACQVGQGAAPEDCVCGPEVI